MILSFDTSNYTTSVALVGEDGTIYADRRKMLAVREGERGLRQSDALFQHLKNLPELLDELEDTGRAGVFAELGPAGALRDAVTAVAVSTRPRSVEGSYMPCFVAGEQAAKSIAAVLRVPVFSFSHQDGHVAAASYGTELEGQTAFLAWHLSGGTCELLKWDAKESARIIGGSLDVSFGQVLDRMGVALGLPFPAGKYIDESALRAADDPDVPAKNSLSKVRVSDLTFNLSGLETQVMRKIDGLSGFWPKMISDPSDEEKSRKSAIRALTRDVMERSAETVAAATRNASEMFETDRVLFAGGVASSAYLRKRLPELLPGLSLAFARPGLSADNAVGIGLLGRKAYLESKEAPSAGEGV
jgi:N6-L-threonylcarbamoyladenine synthase